MELGTKQIVLLVFGAVGLLKAIWALASPLSFKDAAKWSVKVLMHINTISGVLIIIVGVALWGVVLIEADWAEWALILLGAFFVWVGAVYCRREMVEKLMDLVILKQKKTGIRIMFAAIALICCLLIWIALKDAFPATT